MKKIIDIRALALSIVMTLALAYYMNLNKNSVNDMVIGGLIFLVINYFLLKFLFMALGELLKVLSLKGKKLNSYSYYLYPFTLIITFITINMFLVRIGKYFLNQNILVAFVVASIILIALSQLGGAFPDYKREDTRKKALRLEEVGGKFGGFDILGSLTGTYDKGIIIGTHLIEKESLKSMHRSEDSVVIEGMKDGRKSEIIILAKKAKEFFINLLAKELNMPENEIKSGYNVKKTKANEVHLKNRKQRRQEKFNK